MIGRLLGALSSLARALRREADDDDVTLSCRYCHREPGGECTCRKDCGQPDCLWPLWNTLRTDAEISAWLGQLKGKDAP